MDVTTKLHNATLRTPKRVNADRISVDGVSSKRLSITCGRTGVNDINVFMAKLNEMNFACRTRCPNCWEQTASIFKFRSMAGKLLWSMDVSIQLPTRYSLPMTKTYDCGRCARWIASSFVNDSKANDFWNQFAGNQEGNAGHPLHRSSSCNLRKFLVRAQQARKAVCLSRFAYLLALISWLTRRIHFPVVSSVIKTLKFLCGGLRYANIIKRNWRYRLPKMRWWQSPSVRSGWSWSPPRAVVH